jgi:hypothetical protein
MNVWGEMHNVEKPRLTASVKYIVSQDGEVEKVVRKEH